MTWERIQSWGPGGGLFSRKMGKPFPLICLSLWNCAGRVKHEQSHPDILTLPTSLPISLPLAYAKGSKHNCSSFLQKPAGKVRYVLTVFFFFGNTGLHYEVWLKGQRKGNASGGLKLASQNVTEGSERCFFMEMMVIRATLSFSKVAHCTCRLSDVQREMSPKLTALGILCSQLLWWRQRKEELCGWLQPSVTDLSTKTLQSEQEPLLLVTYHFVLVWKAGKQ